MSTAADIRKRFDASRDEALRNLAIQANELAEFAKHPKADQHRVKMRRQALEALGEMIAEAEATMNMMQNCVESETKAIKAATAAEIEAIKAQVEAQIEEAYNLGRDQAAADWHKREAEIPPQYQGASKEGIRELRIKEARATWPELFEKLDFKPKDDEK